MFADEALSQRRIELAGKIELDQEIEPDLAGMRDWFGQPTEKLTLSRRRDRVDLAIRAGDLGFKRRDYPIGFSEAFEMVVEHRRFEPNYLGEGLTRREVAGQIVAVGRASRQ